MSHHIRLSFHVLLSFVILLFAGSASSDEAELAPHGLAGPWVVVADLYPANPESPPLPQFTELMLLHNDGTGTAISATHNFATPIGTDATRGQIVTKATSSVITWRWVAKNVIQLESFRYAIYPVEGGPNLVFGLRTSATLTLTSPDHLEGPMVAQVGPRQYCGTATIDRKELFPSDEVPVCEE